MNGVEVPLVGRVSMDMISVDLRGLPDAQVGDGVVLWGEGLPAETVARAAGTIAYELFCSVTARVPRNYVQGGTSVAVPPNRKGTYPKFAQLSSFAGGSLFHENFFLLFQTIRFLLQDSFINDR